MVESADSSPSELTYDDLAIGDTFEQGATTLTEDDIVSFASEYDPQPFHLDHAAAENSMFGGLVASGLHTFSVCQRLATEAFFAHIAFMGGRGIDEMRWHRPVRPGDTLSASVEIAAMRESDSKPDRGYVDVNIRGMNGDGDVVISWTALAIVGRVV
ncbi:MaoC family dehydratase [Haloferax sp. DFSO60]|uniref:MaoC family dehydratase n=1 Tax=Haloferax sp. DFSO60 TaxID=3388652 RepID=UPI00397990C9